MKMSPFNLKSWLVKEWKPLLEYCPKFSYLSNFWIVFNFLSEEDLALIFNGVHAS